MKTNNLHKLLFVLSQGGSCIHTASFRMPHVMAVTAGLLLPITLPHPHCEKFMYLPSKELGMIKHSDSNSENGG